MERAVRKADVAGAWAGFNGAQSRAEWQRGWAFGIVWGRCFSTVTGSRADPTAV